MSVAALPAAGLPSPGRPSYVYVLAALSVVLVVAGIGLAIWWLRIYRRRNEGATIMTSGQTIAPGRLRDIWEQFLSRLPSAVRTTVPEYSHFVVFGNAGAGKSALIGRKVDWQGQASQFLPSSTADPLMQIFLGSQTVVQELSATLQQATTRGVNAALTRLWRKLDVDQTPTVVVVLMAPALISATPDQLATQAQLLRGKINVLSESCNSSVRVRLCLTHMDRVRGYAELARFLRKHRLPLDLELGTEVGSDLAAGLVAYERHLPRALSTLPLTAFEAIVDFFRNAEQLLTPVATFLRALSEGSVASLRPEVQRLYFSSLGNDEQVGSPFEPPPSERRVVLGAFLTRLLRPLGIRPVHALLGLVLLGLGVAALSVITRQHRTVVGNAGEASQVFARAVERAHVAHSSGESDVVRRAEQQTSQALRATTTDEARWRILHLIYRPDKRDAERTFVDGLRRGYLLPALERALRQRARDKILAALVALYATDDNTLGALVKAQPTDWSTQLDVPRDSLLDYIRYSKEPYSEVALVALPPLPSDTSRWPTVDLTPWRAFLVGVTQAIGRPFVTNEELQQLQRESERLREALVQIQRAGQLRQMYRNLAEESPLDMIKLFGRDVGAITPNPWLVDHQDSLQRLLQLVHDSSLRIEQAGTKSLMGLLRWLNDTGIQSTTGAPVLPREDELLRFSFPGDAASFEVSSHEWHELLLRSRKRTFSLSDLSSSAGSDSSESRSGRTELRRRLRSSKSSHRGCGKRRHGHHHDPLCETTAPKRAARPAERSLPLWSPEEFTPKLAALLTSDELPAAGLSDVYNRAVYHREVLPLVQELKKALSTNRNLSAAEKVSLSRMVQAELASYSRRYCAALLDYHLGYQLSRSSPTGLHSELLELIKPGSPFLARLRTVVDNATLPGLTEPYLQPLAECIAEFRPIVELLEPKAAGGGAARKEDRPADRSTTADKGPDKSADKAADKSADKTADKTADTRAEPRPESKSAGLGEYNEAVAKLVEDLDRTSGTDGAGAGGAGGAAAKPGSSSAALAARLSPLGRSALAMYDGGDDSPLRHAEQFLDHAGITGALRRPFLAPFLAVYQTGAGEIERTLAAHWRDNVRTQVAPLLDRFPFNRAAEREVLPAELDILSERKGSFFNELRGLYAPVLSENAGAWVQRSGALGTLHLPKELVPTVNRLALLSRALFTADGNRKPLELLIRGLPGPQVRDDHVAQPALAFLQVGKATANAFNQQASAVPLKVEWWAQGAAVVGLESVVAKSGRKHTQTLEVADSAWSLFRLLQRSTLDASGVSTWRILSENSEDAQALRFVITPDPWELFGALQR